MVVYILHGRRKRVSSAFFFFFVGAGAIHAFVHTPPWEQLQKLWINLVRCFTVFRRRHLYKPQNLINLKVSLLQSAQLVKKYTKSNTYMFGEMDGCINKSHALFHLMSFNLSGVLVSCGKGTFFSLQTTTLWCFEQFERIQVANGQFMCKLENQMHSVTDNKTPIRSHLMR